MCMLMHMLKVLLLFANNCLEWIVTISTVSNKKKRGGYNANVFKQFVCTAQNMPFQKKTHLQGITITFCSKIENSMHGIVFVTSGIVFFTSTVQSFASKLLEDIILCFVPN